MQNKLKYYLAPYVNCGLRDYGFSLGFGSIKKVFKKEKDYKLLIELMEYVLVPRMHSEIEGFWNDRKGNPKILKLFLKGNYLIEENAYSQANRYSRNSLYYNLYGAMPSKVQEQFSKKKILILGCGGIGNIIAVSLATAGIGTIYLMDDDVIEVSNLTRQFMFTESDIGKKKTMVLKENLARRNSNISVHIIDKAIKKPDDTTFIPEVDLIVLSADKPSTICFWINNFSVSKMIPFINVGYVNDIAVWGPFVIPGVTGCFACQQFFGSKPKLDEYCLSTIAKINSRFQPPSVGPINMIAASLASLDIMRYFGQYGEILSLNKRKGLWTHSLKFDYQTANPNKTCEKCSHLFKK